MNAIPGDCYPGRCTLYGCVIVRSKSWPLLGFRTDSSGIRLCNAINRKKITRQGNGGTGAGLLWLTC